MLHAIQGNGWVWVGPLNAPLLRAPLCGANNGHHVHVVLIIMDTPTSILCPSSTVSVTKICCVHRRLFAPATGSDSWQFFVYEVGTTVSLAFLCNASQQHAQFLDKSIIMLSERGFSLVWPPQQGSSTFQGRAVVFLQMWGSPIHFMTNMWAS